MPADTDPDAFSFAPQTGVALGAAIVSAPATITGINTATPISVTGGEYAINGGAYTSTAGTINNNQTVTVRQTSSAAPLTATTATLTIGGVEADFTVTTAEVQPDSTPDQFQFVDQENVARDTVIVSEPVEITGINSPAPILVTGPGEYSIDGGAFTNVEGVGHRRPDGRGPAHQRVHQWDSGDDGPVGGTGGAGHPDLGCLQQRHAAQRRQQLGRRTGPGRAGPAGPGPAPEEPELIRSPATALRALRKRATSVALFLFRLKNFLQWGNAAHPYVKRPIARALTFRIVRAQKERANPV